MSNLLIVLSFCFFITTSGTKYNAEDTIEFASMESCETLVVTDLSSFWGRVNLHLLLLNSKYDILRVQIIGTESSIVRYQNVRELLDDEYEHRFSNMMKSIACLSIKVEASHCDEILHH